MTQGAGKRGGMRAGPALALSSPPFPEFQTRHQTRAVASLCPQTPAPGSVLLQDWTLLLFAAAGRQIAGSLTCPHSVPRVC